MNKTKLVAGVAALSAFAFALSGCGNGGSSASGSKSQDIIVNGCEPQNPLSSLSTNETCGGNPVSLLYTGLTAITSDGKTKLESRKVHYRKLQQQ